MAQQSFNPKARWDRHIPKGSSAYQEDLNERIDCIALFKTGKIYPQKFIWNNKEYSVTKITYNWQERQGSEILNLFCVDTGVDLYQISFNNTSLRWQIDKTLT